jgi:hypothetical protein
MKTMHPPPFKHVAYVAAVANTAIANGLEGSNAARRSDDPCVCSGTSTILERREWSAEAHGQHEWCCRAACGRCECEEAVSGAGRRAVRLFLLPVPHGLPRYPRAGSAQALEEAPRRGRADRPRGGGGAPPASVCRRAASCHRGEGARAARQEKRDSERRRLAAREDAPYGGLIRSRECADTSTVVVFAGERHAR